MPFQVLTPPSVEPLSLTEAKDHLRVDFSTDDTYITTLIPAARQYVEAICWRGLLTQTVELTLAGFTSHRHSHTYGGSFLPPYGGYFPFELHPHNLHHGIELPGGQAAALDEDAITYIDSNGAQQTLDPSVYSFDNVSVPAKLHLAYGKSYPNTRPQWNAVSITYDVGWATPDDVPSPIKQAMLLLVSQMYEHRTPEVAGVLSAVQFTIDNLLQPYRLLRL